MEFVRQAIPEVVLLTPARHQDDRGFLSVTWTQAQSAALGAGEFVQDNHSYSARRGTVRGLHCQIAPHPQGKLVRVVRGAVWDVAVDVRPGSATYGRYVAAELSAGNWRQLWIPAGFLHGFCTLEPESEVVYKVTGSYDTRGRAWGAVERPHAGDPVADRCGTSHAVGTRPGAAGFRQRPGLVSQLIKDPNCRLRPYRSGCRTARLLPCWAPR